MVGEKDRYLLLRAGRYCYHRRQPKDLVSIIGSGFVRIGLNTNDPEIAFRTAKAINRHTEEYWESVARHGAAAKDKDRYDAAVKVARFMGYRYREAGDIATTASLDEIIDRLREIEQVGIEKEHIVTGLAGGASKPEITTSTALNEF